MDNIAMERALAHFKTLLEEQNARVERMENAEPPVDFSKKDKIIIGVCDGDGIGPIITAEASRVLEKLLAKEIASGKVEIRQIQGLTIERRTELGCAIPPDTLEAIRACDVILKGPTTTPKGGTLESANVAMRRELDLYANCRPVCIPEKNIDWMFFRAYS